MVKEAVGRLKINQQSPISIGLAMSIFAGVLYLVVGQSSVKSDFVHYQEVQQLRFDELRGSVSALSESVRKGTEDRWTRKDAVQAWKQFHMLNPKIPIPEF